jgi:hypothetical protein
MNPYDIIESPGFTEVVLKRVRQEFQRRCRPHCVDGTDLEFVSYIDQMTGDMILRLRASIWAEKPSGQEQVIEYPATWWDAFKERWLSRWLKVEKVRHVIEPYILYPGLKASLPDKEHVMKVMVRTERPPVFAFDNYDAV